MSGMTVMDMTPEALFELVEPQRAAGELTAVDVERCRSRGCHWFGTYLLRGTKVSIATPVRLSPGKAEELGLQDRRIPGRAWLADQTPAGVYYGCAHFLGYIHPAAST